MRPPAPVIDLAPRIQERDAAEASETVALLEASIRYEKAKQRLNELFGSCRQVDHEIALMREARRKGTVEDAREAERRVLVATRRLARAVGRPLEETETKGEERHG